MSRTGPLAGKILLVLGASRGMGRDTAQLLAQRGAQVIVASRDEAACAALAEELAASGGTATAMTADICNAAQVEALIARIDSQFGRLDGAFNNAGKILGFGPITQTGPDDLAAAMQLNAGGVHNALRAQIPLIARSGGGSIVVNSATSGIRGKATIGLYSAAKAAAIVLAQVAAQEAGPQGVRVNAIAPGYIGTDAWMAKLGAQKEALGKTVPLQRIGTGAEVAGVVAWLLGDDASYVTGAVIPIDGGMHAS